MLEELEEFSLPNELKKLERGRTFCSPAALNQLVRLTPSYTSARHTGWDSGKERLSSSNLSESGFGRLGR